MTASDVGSRSAQVGNVVITVIFTLRGDACANHLREKGKQT